VEQQCTSSLTITLKSMVPKSIKNKNKHSYSMFIARRKKNCGGIFSPESKLGLAVTRGDLAEVKRLVIDCGANPNGQSTVEGGTPLHTAADRGYLRIVEFLLEHGANPNMKNNYGSTPLHYAAMYGYPEVVELLLEHGANPNIQSNYGSTPLHYAAMYGYPEVVELLLEHGANPNIQNRYGYTPLHFAIEGCFVDVVRVLLDHGADPTIRDNEGRTPLDYGSNCEEIIEELRRGGSRTRVYE